MKTRRIKGGPVVGESAYAKKFEIGRGFRPCPTSGTAEMRTITGTKQNEGNRFARVAFLCVLDSSIRTDIAEIVRIFCH